VSFRQRLYTAVIEAGYTDLLPGQLLLYRYPTIEGMHPGELAAQMGISKQAMNDLLRQMEAKGYLQLRPDPRDRRARLINLTERGVELMEFVRSESQVVADEWARIAGRERYEQLRETLVELVQATSGQDGARSGH
jgi:DNA-binding MarR family transcriptional regulator